VGFIVLAVANFAAIAVGYDGQLINVGGEDLQSLQNIEVKRHSALAGQSNKLVALILTLPFLLFLTKKKVGFGIYVLAIALATATTFLSGSRSGIALTALFTLTGAVWLIGSSKLRNIAILGGAAGCLALFVFFNSDGALSRVEQSRFGEEILVKRVLAALDGNAGESGTLREEYVTDAWQLFYQKPLIGYGPDAFGKVSGAGTYAHNNYAEIAVNWGIIGLLLYYSMYLATLARIGQNLSYKLPMVATLLFLMLSDLWFVTFVNRSLVLCLCLLMVAVFAASPAGSHASSHSHSRHSSSRSGRRRRRRRHATAEKPEPSDRTEQLAVRSNTVHADTNLDLAEPGKLTLAEQHQQSLTEQRTLTLAEQSQLNRATAAQPELPRAELPELTLSAEPERPAPITRADISELTLTELPQNFARQPNVNSDQRTPSSFEEDGLNFELTDIPSEQLEPILTEEDDFDFELTTPPKRTP